MTTADFADVERELRCAVIANHASTNLRAAHRNFDNQRGGGRPAKFRAIVTVPNDNLRPERSTNDNLGVIVEPTTGLRLSVDYWNYRYPEIIVKKSAQQIANANPNDPRVIRQGGLARGQIARVYVTSLNAKHVLTDGIDASLNWQTPTGVAGIFGLAADATWLSRYLVTSPGLNGNLAGFRNFENFALALPKLWTNFTGNWSMDGRALTANVRRIGAYRENLANLASRGINFRLNR